MHKKELVSSEARFVEVMVSELGLVQHRILSSTLSIIDGFDHLYPWSLKSFSNFIYSTSLNSGFRSSLYPAYCAYFPRPLSLLILAQYATLARILSRLYR